MTTPNSNPQSSGLPASSTFSFKAPFPVSPPSHPPSSAAVSALKHRRVSLASPSSPRLVQPWAFRDEMGLHVQPPAASSSPPAAAAAAVPEKKGKIRKLDPKLDDQTAQQDKKPRKKWSNEETQMLVQGCQIHGVGNWKTILQDPDLKFHDRSAVDLKDRFRTYFPDAYQRHYPNARTHLSSKIRSTLADGTSLFEKTRSKRRRPFTDAEDRALKAGYEKHGTTWATIVKDPIFAEQNRRSTDLRDRFRNAFPDLYQAAGYKPRSASKKKLLLEGRAADDQLSTTAGPVRSRRRAKTSQGLLRGGTKSVPQSTVCSEDEESEEEESESSQLPVFVENVSTASYRSPTKKSQTTTTATTTTTTTTTTNNVPTLASTADTQIIDADDEMELLTLDSTDALNIPDFLPNNVHSDMETWSSGLNTPTHSSTAAWSTAAVSPSSSHISDLFMNAAAGTSTASSPFIQRRTTVSGHSISGNGNSIDNNFGMIGKSAWGTDWFSPNPRLDASSTSSHSNSSSSFMDPANFSPASPFSFQGHLNHGVLDRYDLFPPYMPDGNVSEAGLGDAFGDDDGMGCFGSAGGGSGGGASGSGNGAGAGAGASSGGTGFKGYHSQIAGDLISGDGARMHHHHHNNNHHNNHNHHHHHHNNHQPTAFSLSSLYGTSFASGFGHSAAAAADAGATSSSSTGLGLGLEGIPENASVNVTGIHPMQLHSHASSSSSSLGLSLGVTGVTLSENGEGVVVGDGGGSSAPRQDDDAMDEGEEGQQQSQSQVQENQEGGGDIQGASSSDAAAGTLTGARQDEPDMDEEDSSLMPFGMEDLVDMNELHHATPPGTPLVTQPRPMRRSEGSWLSGFEGGFGFGGFGGGGAGGFGVGSAGGGNGGGANGGGGGGGNGHARSISVPPSEAARNGHHHDVGVPMSVDDVGLHSMHLSLEYQGFASGIGMGGLHSIFGSSSAAASASTEDQRFQLEERQSRTVDPQRLGVAHSPTSPSGISLHRQQQQHHHQQHHHQQQHHHHQQETQLHVDDDDDDDDEQHQHTSELTPLFPANLILSPAGAVTSVSLPSSSSQGSEHANGNGPSSRGGSGHHTPVIDHRHTPVIDHRHTPVIEQRDELWRSAPSSSFSSFSAFSGDYNLPFLDLHYYAGGGGGSLSSMFGNNHNNGVNHNVNHHGQSHHPQHSQSHHLHPHPHHLNLHLHNTLGLDVSSLDDLYSTTTTTGMTMEATRQGQALDLAQTNAQMGSFGVGGNVNANLTTNPNPNSAPGGLGGFERTPSPSGTIRVHQQEQHRRKPLLGETFSPPGDSRDAVDVGANANVKGNGNEDRRRRLSDSNSNGTSASTSHNNMSTSNSSNTNNSNGTSRSKSMTRSTSDDSRAGAGRGAARVRKFTTAGNKTLTNVARTTPSTTTTTTTIPAPTRATPTPTTTTIGRSMSHHRGQSAASAAASGSGVCPRDLMLRSGDTHKRKRASWDGGLG